MLVQAELGIPMDKIEVIHGDTDLIPVGVGTYGSRSLQLGGSAVHKAAIEVKEEPPAKAAQALCEEILYDADGNPLTSSLADYGAITAAELPSFELVTSETPTDLNPLGAKGIGEAGTIGATPAVHNAVIDAVSHLGVRHI